MLRVDHLHAVGSARHGATSFLIYEEMSADGHEKLRNIKMEEMMDHRVWVEFLRSQFDIRIHSDYKLPWFVGGRPQKD